MNPFLSGQKHIFLGLFCIIGILLIAPPHFFAGRYPN